MGLNKSKGNMFNFIDYTWNPIAGYCSHKCGYCSTNKLRTRYDVLKDKYSGPMRLVEKELKTNLGKDNFIFVAAQNDLFADEIDSEDVFKVLNHCYKYDNKYFFQTKNPERIKEFLTHPIFRYNKSIISTTIESNRLYKEMGNAPHPMKRALDMKEIKLYTNNNIPLYLTIEPIMDFDQDEFIELINLFKPEQITIGADSGNNNLNEPSIEKINSLIFELKKLNNIVRIKNNIKKIKE